MRTVLEKYRSSMNPAERDIVRKFLMEPRLRLPFMLSGLLAGSMVQYQDIIHSRWYCLVDC